MPSNAELYRRHRRRGSPRPPRRPAARWRRPGRGACRTCDRADSRQAASQARRRPASVGSGRGGPAGTARRSAEAGWRRHRMRRRRSRSAPNSAHGSSDSGRRPQAARAQQHRNDRPDDRGVRSEAQLHHPDDRAEQAQNDQEDERRRRKRRGVLRLIGHGPGGARGTTTAAWGGSLIGIPRDQAEVWDCRRSSKTLSRL